MVLEKEDEMDCLVAGCNFLLKAIKYEAFAYEDNQPRFIPTQGSFCDPDIVPIVCLVVGSCSCCHAVRHCTAIAALSGATLSAGAHPRSCT